MRILILGVTGMVGNTVFKCLSRETQHQVWGTLRGQNRLQHFSKQAYEYLYTGVDALDHDSLVTVFTDVQPDVVINCVGVVKQFANANDPLIALPINAIFPHRLAKLCSLVNARLIHISSDCVFSGEKGNYSENDFTDAQDMYGKSKALGELSDSHTVTLRTSTIGYELESNHGLLNWFLSQQEQCKGYTRAVFSGLPTVILAQVIRDEVIPKLGLSGLYQVAAKPISKFDLLLLIADTYNKAIDIVPDETLIIDRSLDASRFQAATGYIAPEWPDMINTMHLYK